MRSARTASQQEEEEEESLNTLFYIYIPPTSL